MTLTVNDNPLLVAPRPVRLATPLFARSHPVRLVSASDHMERLRIADSNSDVDDHKVGLYLDPSEKDVASPRSSPRSGLPTEALEEFLSILRPSFFPPSSPVLFTRRQGAVSLPTFQHERSYSYKGRGRLEIMPQKSDLSMDDIPEISRSTQPSRNACSPESTSDDAISELDDSLPVRWFTSNVLSSPISRMHTRNPFQRHPSYPMNPSPGPVSPMSPLSPAAIPLPLPTPDEFIEGVQYS